MPRNSPRILRVVPKKEPMVKISIELPIPLGERVARGAAEDDRSVSSFLRRWIVANIDAMDPAGAEGDPDE